MNKLINLHFNSEYSFFESPTNLKTYIKRAKENNIKTLVLTDHNNVFGYAEFRKLCEENNIKSIFGIDLDVEEYRLILLAKNLDGIKEIYNFAFWKSENKKINLNEISDKNLFIINHPIYGFKDVDFLLNKYKDFYFYEMNNAKSNIFINDNRIVDLQQKESLFFVNELKELKLNDSYDYLFSQNHNVPIHLIEQTNEIASKCNVVFPNETNLLPEYKNDLNLSSNDYLKHLIYEGLNKYKSELKLFDENVVNKRIKYEFDVIKKINVSNYFLIIADLIKWSKKQGIYIGPGRGSVSGSLISYLIEITEVNPLKYGLYFERFLNEERITLPDIDIDIQDNRREEVIEYLKNKYGRHSVAQICTFQRMGAKQSLKDVGRYLNIPFTEINDISKLISGNDSLSDSYEKNNKFKARIESSEEYEKLFHLATKIESLPRQTGMHAAGIVLSKNNIINNVPIMSVDNNIVTQFSMEYLESWGLLKIDLLGLRTLTTIQEIEKDVQKLYDSSFDISKIPLNDEKTNKLLTSGKVSGIFQLESSGMTSTLEKVQIHKFEDLVDIISLYRPGPMSNIPTYIHNKFNKLDLESILPEYDNVVKQTNGIIIYQEQIMEIAQNVAKMSFTQSDLLRWAIGKKKKEQIDKLKSLFIEGSIKNGVNVNIANRIYEQIEKFAEYGFNKSHAVAYAILSYKMAYLKVKYPICFYSSIISSSASIETINKYVKEAREVKFNIESPMINKISEKIVHNNKNTIWLPLTFVKGLGKSVLDKLLIEYNEHGPFNDFFSFIARAKKAQIHDSTIDILIESNTLREFGNMKTLIQNKEKALVYASVVQWIDKETNEINIDLSIKPPILEMCERDLQEESTYENKYLGMIYNAFVTSKYETEDKLNNLKVGIEYRIILYISKKKEMMNKFKKMSYILYISDSSSQDIVFFNEKNKSLYERIKEGSIGYANILKLDRNGKKYLYINDWREI